MKLAVELREKTDRYGNKYLFGAIAPFNLVLFVHDDGERGGVRRAVLVVKPYTPRNNDDEAWNEERLSQERRGPAPAPTGKVLPAPMAQTEAGEADAGGKTTRPPRP